MSPKSVGSDRPSTKWAVADHAETSEGGSVLFSSEKWPGVWLAITVTSHGTVTGVEVRTEETSGITTRLLRSVRLAELAREAVAELRDGADARWLAGDHREETLLRTLALRSTPLGRPGRRGHPPEYYARLAVLYERWLTTGQPLAVLASSEAMSESALRAALNTARRKGFLTDAPAGRAGGVATERAKELLGFIDQEE